MTEYQESTSITFEWTVKGLKNLFDSSRGDNKSRVTRSLRFGGGKWQILFYANSGDGSFVSLYLNCEPTLEEKEGAPNGKWVREGQYKFSFELSSSKSILFNMKEACDHVFSYKTQNWGWAQFAKRDAVYYGASSVRQSDSFVIICTITSSPSVPVNPSKIRKRAVPLAMLDVVGSLLDDPAYSDIEFVFPNKRVTGDRTGRNECQRIWACKKLLSRADYFNSMFSSGFMENSSGYIAQPNQPQSSDHTFSPQHHVMEDSDLEDEAAEAETTSLTGDEGNEAMTEVEEIATPIDDQHSQQPASDTNPNVARRSDSEEMEDVQNSGEGTADEGQGNTHRRTERLRQSTLVRIEPSANLTFDPAQLDNSGQDAVPGPLKSRVVLRDAAYNTYFAVLYYIYTDSIIFAPLASSFLHKTKKHARTSSQRANGDPPPDTPRDGEESMSSIRPGLSRRATQPLSQIGEAATNGVSIASSTTRAQWIKAWEYENSGRPLPCSAKAVYRLADKLDLAELKERAREHIIKSLTVANVPHEVFSSFSAAFEDIRKVQMDYFLANWGEIRGSEAMSGVWQQIRNGRHPGFEEVWPLIASNLEYRATQAEGTVGDEREGMPAE